jgi:GntR family transcriptional regulator, carbon starvation induced regulator
MNDLALLWGPNAAGALPGAPKTMGEDVLRRLHNDIVSGVFQPDEKLKPDELKDRYDTGVSPIREALLRLSAEGLVVAQGQRGFRVAPMSEEELQDIARIRTHLSCLALSWSIDRGDDRWEGRVLAAFHRLERIAQPMLEDPASYAEEWEIRNREFHLALENECGSPWLLHFSNLAFSQSERYRRYFIKYQTLLPHGQDEHKAIMDAALARDHVTAGRLLEQHISHGAELVLQAMRDARQRI